MMPSPKKPPMPKRPQSPLEKRIPLQEDSTARQYESLISSAPGQSGLARKAAVQKKSVIGGV